MKNVKSFVLGFIVCLILTGMVYGASQVAEVYFSSFPIKVNGNSYNAQMPVLNYQGKTYLALREFATVTDNEVDFKDNTIIINNKDYVPVVNKDVYSVGDTVSLGGTQLKVERIKKTSYIDYYYAKSGNQFVTVYFTLKNIGYENLSYSPLNFSMQNSKGQITTYSWEGMGHDTNLESGELAPNGTISASLTFEEPQNDYKLTLIYKNNYFSDNLVKIEL